MRTFALKRSALATRLGSAAAADRAAEEGEAESNPPLRPPAAPGLPPCDAGCCCPAAAAPSCCSWARAAFVISSLMEVKASCKEPQSGNMEHGSRLTVHG